MNTYSVKAHVENVGMVQVTISAYTPNDAQNALKAQYGGAKVIIYNTQKVG